MTATSTELDSPFPRLVDGKHTQDARMLAQQQVRLLNGMSRLLRRLLRSFLWPLLSPQERWHVFTLVASLESDLKLAHTIAKAKATLPSAVQEAPPSAKARRWSVPPVAGNGQEALP